MPLQGLDFSKSNQAIARFNQFLSYDLLDKMRSDRDVEIMKIQDRLMREREVERGNIDIGVARYKSALTDKEAYTAAYLDIIKKPEYEADHALAMLATDENLPAQFHPTAQAAAKRWAARVIPLALAHSRASRGEATQEDFEVLNYYSGFKGSEEGMKEEGANFRAKLAAEVDREKLGVEEKRIGDTGAGRTQAAAEKMTDRYIKWVDDTVSYLVGEGVQGQAMTGEMPIYLESKSRDPLSSKDRGFVLTYLQNIKTQILRQGYESLTDGQLAFISKVYNTPAVQGFVSDKLIPKPAAGARPPRPGGSPAPMAEGTQGGLNPYTGNTATDEAGIQAQKRQALVNHYTELYIQQVYGGVRSPENIAQATADANEFISKYIMK